MDHLFYYQDSEIPFTIPEVNRSVFRLLRLAVLKQRIVRISYTDSCGEDSSREIFPEVIFCSGDNDCWYIAAYCYLREEPRTFCIDRIQRVELTGRRDTSYGIAGDFRENGIPWQREYTPEYEEPPPQEITEEEKIRRATFELIYSIEHLNAERIKNALKNGADLHAVDAFGCTLIHYAKISFEHIKALIEKYHFPVDGKDSQGNTLLHDAAKAMDLDTIKYLLELGAEETGNRNGITPLEIFLSGERGKGDSLWDYVDDPHMFCEKHELI